MIIFEIKSNAMTTIIKKGFSKEDVEIILDKIKIKKSKSLKKYFGILPIEGDAVAIQKNLRNEWK